MHNNRRLTNHQNTSLPQGIGKRPIPKHFESGQSSGRSCQVQQCSRQKVQRIGGDSSRGRRWTGGGGTMMSNTQDQSRIVQNQSQESRNSQIGQQQNANKKQSKFMERVFSRQRDNCQMQNQNLMESRGSHQRLQSHNSNSYSQNFKRDRQRLDSEDRGSSSRSLISNGTENATSQQIEDDLFEWTQKKRRNQEHSESSGFDPFPIQKKDYTDPYREQESEEENYLLTRLNQEEEDNDSIYSKSRPIDDAQQNRDKVWYSPKDCCRITQPSSDCNLSPTLFEEPQQTQLTRRRPPQSRALSARKIKNISNNSSGGIRNLGGINNNRQGNRNQVNSQSQIQDLARERHKERIEKCSGDLQNWRKSYNNKREVREMTSHLIELVAQDSTSLTLKGQKMSA